MTKSDGWPTTIQRRRRGEEEKESKVVRKKSVRDENKRKVKVKGESVGSLRVLLLGTIDCSTTEYSKS